MNAKFSLKGIKIAVNEVPIEIGELSFEVSDYNLLEGLTVAKELPAIVKQLKEAIESSAQDSTEEFSDEVYDKLTEAFYEVQSINQFIKKNMLQLKQELSLIATKMKLNSHFNQDGSIRAYGGLGQSGSQADQNGNDDGDSEHRFYIGAPGHVTSGEN